MLRFTYCAKPSTHTHDRARVHTRVHTRTCILLNETHVRVDIRTPTHSTYRNTRKTYTYRLWWVYDFQRIHRVLCGIYLTKPLCETKNLEDWTCKTVRFICVFSISFPCSFDQSSVVFLGVCLLRWFRAHCCDILTEKRIWGTFRSQTPPHRSLVSGSTTLGPSPWSVHSTQFHRLLSVDFFLGSLDPIQDCDCSRVTHWDPTIMFGKPE